MLRVTNGILIAAKIMGIGTFSWWWIIGITLAGVICKVLSNKVDIKKYYEKNQNTKGR